MATSPAELDGLDGRRRRTERGREAVVDALLGLLESQPDAPAAAAALPSVEEVASRAGVSTRSLFRYFDDVEALFAAAVERYSARVAPLYALPELPASLDGRLDVVVRHRARLFETIAPVRRAAERRMGSSAVLAAGVEESRRYLRTQVADAFAPELAAAPRARRPELLDALDVALGFSTWLAMRDAHGLSVARAKAVARRTAHALLTP